jgi:DNA topoisomerase IA
MLIRLSNLPDAVAHREIQSHVSEPFWYIHVTSPPGPTTPATPFTWARGRLYDRDAAALLYEACCEAPTATVVGLRGSERRRAAPVPLSTLDMLARGTQYLRLPGEGLMKMAEELYQAGFISYPRTETDVFPPGMDLLVRGGGGGRARGRGKGKGEEEVARGTEGGEEAGGVEKVT